MKFSQLALIVLSLLIFQNSAAPQDTESASPSNAQLLQLIKDQQKQIDALKMLLEKMGEKVQTTDDKVEATVEVLESNLSPVAQSETKIGGYGELHYTEVQNQKELDLHRFVLFISHDFTDNTRFYSELEVEHAVAGDGQPGAVELEQAFVEMDLTEKTRLRTGLFLMPIGIISETHEPTTFYGVERNAVEKHIIPTTWAETGAWLSSELLPGLNLDFALHSGLQVPIDTNKAFLPRSGRQKGANANATALAYTGRIKYTAIPGLELAASYQYQEDISQNLDPAPATLWSTHLAYQNDAFALRALFARWDIDNINASLVGRNQQQGYYVEPSYKLSEKLGIFARFSQWDNSAGNNFDTAIDQTNLGLNFWPTEDVVFKVDYQKQSGALDGHGFNLGMGYQF